MANWPNQPRAHRRAAVDPRCVERRIHQVRGFQVHASGAQRLRPKKERNPARYVRTDATNSRPKLRIHVAYGTGNRGMETGFDHC